MTKGPVGDAPRDSARRSVSIALAALLVLAATATDCTPSGGSGAGGTGGGPGAAGRGGDAGGAAGAGRGGSGGTAGTRGDGGDGGDGGGAVGGSLGGAANAGTGGDGGTGGSGGAGGGAGAGGDRAGAGGGADRDGAALDSAIAGRGGAGGAGAADGGAGKGGAGGSAGGDDGRMAAQVLDGFAILKPCVSSFKPSGNASNSGDCCCEELAANENQHITKQFGGDPSVTYNVTLRIAGVAERYWYAGGTLDAAGKVFYTGGLPTIHGAAAPNNNLRPGQGACKIHPPDTDAQFALPFTVPVEIRPSDGCYNGFNIFAMTVASPKQSYYLNYTTDFDGVDRQPHSVYKTDYTVTLPIAGQARLEFYTVDGDHHQVTNNGTMTVPGLKTAQPYNGNFLELTVVAVTRAN